MPSHQLASAVAAAVLLAGASTAHADPSYSLRFLPTGFAASQMNNAGQIVGTADGAAAVLSGGTLTSLADVLGPSTGRAINNAGDVAGELDGYFTRTAFSYRSGVLTNIGPKLTDHYSDSFASAINDQGVTAGDAIPPIGESWNGFIYQNGAVGYVGTLGGDGSELRALNNHGAATGYAMLPTPNGFGPSHAYYYSDGTMHDIGTLGGTFSEGSDLNDAGDVVGSASVPDDGPSRAFLYRNGSMIDLGALGDLGSDARAINNHGLIVGNSYLSFDDQHAFLYQDGKLVDLNGLIDPLTGWTLTDAFDVNDAGQILGTACQRDSCTSVLLTPVPEPAAGAMLLAGLSVLAARRRRAGGRAATGAATGAGAARAASA